MSKTVTYRYQSPPRIEISPGNTYYEWSVHAKRQFHGLIVYHRYPQYRGNRAVEVLDTNTGKVWTVYRQEIVETL